MTGNQRFLFRLSGIVLLVDIILNLLLIPKYGLTGAAAGTSISLSILYLVALFWTKQKLSLWPYDKRYCKGMIAFIVTVLGVLLIKYLFQNVGIVSIILQGIAALIIFLLSLYIQKLDEEDRKFMEIIGRKKGDNKWGS
jgi:O-antigen/teichoic acid export membrane protein